MPLRKVVEIIPFGAGLDQKTDLRYLGQSGAAQMQNCVRVTQGTVVKRIGMTGKGMSYVDPIQGATTINTAAGAGAYKGTPLLYGAGRSGGGQSGQQYTMMYSQTAGDWTPIGLTPDVGIKDRLTLTERDQFNTYAYESLNGYHVFAFGGTDLNLYAMAIDSSGAIVLPPQQISVLGTEDAQGLRLVADAGANKIYLVYADGAGIWARTLICNPITTAGFGARVAVVTAGGLSNFGIFDIVPLQGSPGIYLMGYVTSGNALILATVNASWTIQSSVTVEAAAVNLDGVSVDGVFNESAWIIYKLHGTSFQFVNSVPLAGNNFGALRNRVTVGNYAPQNGGIIGTMAITRISSTQAYAFFSPYAGTASSTAMVNGAALTFCMVTVTAGVNAFTVLSTAPSVLMHSRPYVASNGYVYGMVYVPSKLQGTQYLVRYDVQTGYGSGGISMQHIATIGPRLMKTVYPAGLGNPNPAQYQTLCHVAQSGSVVFALTLANQSATNVAAFVQPFDTAETRRFSGGLISDQMIVAGGQVTNIDGTVQTEAGFAYYPELNTPGSTPAGAIPAGTYSWVFVYEWLDSLGNIHQSAPSPPITLTPGIGFQVTFTSLILSLTYRAQSNAQIKPNWASVQPVIRMYRAGNNGTSGSIYYDTGVTAPASTTGAAPTLNDNTADYSANAVLYKTGGTLPNFCPPSARCCISHATRWWIGGCDDPTILWATQAHSNGFGPRFNEVLATQCSGAIRALASMDDKIVIFIQRGNQYGIEFMTGIGPTNSGALSDWQSPQQVPGNVGAIDQRSVVVTNKGIVFQGNLGGKGYGFGSGPLGPGLGGGFWLLGRDLSLKYIGANVEAYLGSLPVVTSGVLHPTNGRVYLTCVDQEPSPNACIRLVWDTIQEVWSVDTPFDADTAANGIAIGAASIASSVTTYGPPGLGYAWMSKSGRMYVENVPGAANSYQDVSAGGSPTWITATYETARMQFPVGKFGRWWRVQFGGDALDSPGAGFAGANLTMTLNFDGVPAYSETMTLSDAQLTGGYGFPQIDLEMVPGSQKAREIQVTMTDAAATSGTPGFTGQGFRYGQLVLEAGVDGGRYVNIPGAMRG